MNIFLLQPFNTFYVIMGFFLLFVDAIMWMRPFQLLFIFNLHIFRRCLNLISLILRRFIKQIWLFSNDPWFISSSLSRLEKLCKNDMYIEILYVHFYKWSYKIVAIFFSYCYTRYWCRIPKDFHFFSTIDHHSSFHQYSVINLWNQIFFIKY